MTDVELRQLETVHQARLLINQIETSCNDVWGALERLEDIEKQAKKAVKKASVESKDQQISETVDETKKAIDKKKNIPSP